MRKMSRFWFNKPLLSSTGGSTVQFESKKWKNKKKQLKGVYLYYLHGKPGNKKAWHNSRRLQLSLIVQKYGPLRQSCNGKTFHLSAASRPQRIRMQCSHMLNCVLINVCWPWPQTHPSVHKTSWIASLYLWIHVLTIDWERQVHTHSLESCWKSFWEVWETSQSTIYYINIPAQNNPWDKMNIKYMLCS